MRRVCSILEPLQHERFAPLIVGLQEHDFNGRGAGLGNRSQQVLGTGMQGRKSLRLDRSRDEFLGISIGQLASFRGTLSTGRLLIECAMPAMQPQVSQAEAYEKLIKRLRLVSRRERHRDNER